MTANLDSLGEWDRRAVRKELARRSFWGYRLMLRPRNKDGWWQRNAAGHLQEWWERYKRGERPKLVIEAPPQHGKSELVVDFISWIQGVDPSLATIYASFSERLGVRANLALQRIHDSRRYRELFPNSGIPAPSGAGRSFNRNRELLELYQGGSFRNTTVDGSITGEGLDIGVIDDPIKGRKEANSPAIRDKTWDWLNDDFFTRFADHAGLIAILTRWHVDDPIGRLVENDPAVVVVKYPALATSDVPLMPSDPRTPGSEEPLFSEHKSAEFLAERRRTMTEASWQSLYQQSPYVVGGGLFKIESFEYADQAPAQRYIARSVRYWDKAATKDGGDYTVGVLMHKLDDGSYCIADVVRGQWSTHERDRKMRATAERDGKLVQPYYEIEPGSSGKDSAKHTALNLEGFRPKGERVTGDKSLRAEDYAAQIEAGNVTIVRGPWVRAFLSEHELFPNGQNDDQVDAASGAYRALSTGNRKAVW